jgi:hypothetical protein
MADAQVETVKDCHHPWTWMMVSADGSVKPCCWAPGNLGNLYQSDADAIWNGKEAQALRQAVLENKIHAICANSPCKYVQNTARQHFTDVSQKGEKGKSQKVIPIVQHELNVTSEDVVAAYKLFLNRLPENDEVVNLRVGRNAQSLLTEFLLSPEFRKRQQLDPVILTLASEILKRQQLGKK